MGNCLVTKLKGVVDNSSLEKLGEIRFTNDSDTSEAISLNFFGGGRITLVGEGHLYDFNNVEIPSGTVVTTSSDEQCNAKVGTGSSISISSKYNLGRCVTQMPINTNVFKYSNDIYSVTLKPTVCETFADFKNCTTVSLSGEDVTASDFINLSNGIIVFDLNCRNVNDDVANLASKSNMIRAHIVGCSNVHGNIEDIYALRKIESLRFGSTFNVTGSMAGLLNKMANVTNDPQYGGQRLSGTMTFQGGPNTTNLDNSSNIFTVKFGTSMVNPTAEDTERGWQYS